MRIATAEKRQAPPAQTSFAVEKDEVAPTIEAPSTSTALAISAALPSIVPAEFFRPDGSAAILEAIKANVRAQAAQMDISTEARRKEIASLAYAVAKDKTKLDAEGKALVAGVKEQVKAIDRERAKVWDEMEALQAEVRKPLTDWENAQKERIGNHEAALKLIQEAAVMPALHTPADVENRIAYVKQLHERQWEEFRSRADLLTAGVVSSLETTLQLAQLAEANQIELARLRAEETERKEQERIQRIRDEAAAEERRKAEALRIEQAEAAERERKRMEVEAAEAEARARQAEAERVVAEERAAQAARDAEARRVREAEEAEQRARDAQERAAQALLEAEQQRQREAEWAEQKRIAAEKEAARAIEAEREAAAKREQAAIENERQRVAAEDERVRLETEKRERNKKHRTAVELAAVEALMSRGVSKDASLLTVAAIREGLIPNVTINY